LRTVVFCRKGLNFGRKKYMNVNHLPGGEAVVCGWVALHSAGKKNGKKGGGDSAID